MKFMLPPPLRLLFDLSARDLKTRFAGSHLGLLWAFIVPLFTSIVFIFVFGILMKGAMIGKVYARFDFTTLYFLGYAPWLLFSDVIVRSTSLLRENRSLIRNLHFNHRLLPVSIFFSSAVAHVVVVTISFGLIAFNGYPVSDHLYMLPLCFVLLFAFTLGISFLVSALSAYVSDFAQAVPIAMNLWFFATPILYTPQLIEQSNSRIAKFLLLEVNPMTHFVEGYRTSMVQVAGGFDSFSLAMMAFYAVLSLAVGYFAYRHLEKGFADVL